MQGKIKSIPVTEVKEGIQVAVHKMGIPGYLIFKVASIYNKGNTVQLYPDITVEKSQLKTLVVEYEEKGYEDQLESKEFVLRPFLNKRQLPLKYSQWQAAIDNDEVDSDKTVEFEIIKTVINSKEYSLDVAKVIPQRNKMDKSQDICREILEILERGEDINRYTHSSLYIKLRLNID